MGPSRDRYRRTTLASRALTHFVTFPARDSPKQRVVSTPRARIGGVSSISQPTSLSGLWRRRCPLATCYMDGALHSSLIANAARALPCLFATRLLFDFHTGARALTSSRSEGCLKSTRHVFERIALDRNRTRGNNSHYPTLNSAVD